MHHVIFAETFTKHLNKCDYSNVYIEKAPVLQIPIAQSPEATCFRTGLPTLRDK